ncbi:MAG: RNA polymerase sigma factor [Phycisphaerales bacterium]|nr:RNA polymerase sigma factor [Phycisphaerales bacterium]
MESLTPDEFAHRFRGAMPRLWCIAVGVLGRRDGAEDVVQEAALIGLRKRSEFSPGTSFEAWMGQIVRFTALNTARRRKAERLERVPEQAAQERAAHPVTPDGLLRDDQRDFDDDVTHALGTLDPTARASLLLRTVLDLSYREIAEVLEIPEGTAMSHVHRSRKAMRLALGGRE